jgi:site-specific recombinase XerD
MGTWRERQLTRLAEARPEVQSALKAGAVVRRLTWDTVTELFLRCWEADHPGIRPRTLDHYREQLESRLVAYAIEREIEDAERFTKNDLRAFVLWLDTYRKANGAPLSQRGKQMGLDCAKRLFSWLYREKLVPEDITEGIRSYKLDSLPEPKATSEEDLETLLASFSPETAAGIRNTAMIILMAKCGLRVGELVGLNASHLIPTEGRLRVPSEASKSRRVRYVDLPLIVRDGIETVEPKVAEVLTTWLGIRAQAFPELTDEDPLFVTLEPGTSSLNSAHGRVRGPVRPAGRRLTPDNVRCMLSRAAKKAGLDPRAVMPHKLRHHFGLASVIAGVPITALMRAMGHKSPLMTARYATFADSERRSAFARAGIASDLRFPGQPKPKLPSAKDITIQLEHKGSSLSEVARELFHRD